MSNLLLGIILGCWNGIGIVVGLSGPGISTALTNGVVAGLCMGDFELGLQIGATCLLMSIGFYTYGGATIPDYSTGALFGTVLAASAANAGLDIDAKIELGVVAAAAIALLMTEMDILGRASTTVFQHLGEKALAENNIKKFETVTLAGVLPWFLSRMIPVLVGMLFIDQLSGITAFANSVEWISNGLVVVGGILPAVGFALLLSYMDLTKYWPFLVLGYVLYAFANMGTIALALVGLAAAGLMMGVAGGAK